MLFLDRAEESVEVKMEYFAGGGCHVHCLSHPGQRDLGFQSVGGTSKRRPCLAAACWLADCVIE